MDTVGLAPHTLEQVQQLKINCTEMTTAYQQGKPGGTPQAQCLYPSLENFGFVMKSSATLEIYIESYEFQPVLLQKWKPIFDRLDGNGEFMALERTHELSLLYPNLNRFIRSAAFVVVPRSERPSVVHTCLEQYKCRPPPFMMPLLSLIQIGVFIYYATEMGGVDPKSAVPFKSPLIYDPFRRYEAWRFFTYVLIHSGSVHIGTNILVQMLLGIPLETVHSWWRVFIIYMAGVVAGSLGNSVTDPSVYLAGASGGVYALLFAHLASLVLNWNEMEYAIWRLIFIVILVGADVGSAISCRYIAEIDTKVSYAAHFAGALAGLLVGVNVLRNLRVEKWKNVVRWICFASFVFLMVAMVALNVLWPAHFPPPRF